MKSSRSDEMEMQKAVRNMKLQLKKLSKNQLVRTVIQQAHVNVEQQDVNKVLLEKLKKFEGESDAKDNSSNDTITE